MKLCGVPILSILLLLLFSCASGHREPYPDNLPPSRDLASLEVKLKNLCAGSAHLEVDDIGRIEYEEFSATIWVVRHRPPRAERYVLITGGVHGSEPAGAAWVVDLIATIGQHPEAFSNVNLDCIPLVNPWGWSRDIRFNRQGQDINRDFASFETQEARILKKEFAPRRYDLVIDHHEDPDAAGFYLYQYAKRDTGLSREVIAAIRALGYPIEQDVQMVVLRTRDGLIDAPRWGLTYMRMTGQLSITNYLRLEHSREVYTIETPVRLPMEDRVLMHRRAFELIFDGVLR